MIRDREEGVTIGDWLIDDIIHQIIPPLMNSCKTQDVVPQILHLSFVSKRFLCCIKTSKYIDVVVKLQLMAIKPFLSYRSERYVEVKDAINVEHYVDRVLSEWKKGYQAMKVVKFLRLVRRILFMTYLIHKPYCIERIFSNGAIEIVYYIGNIIFSCIACPLPQKSLGEIEYNEKYGPLTENYTTTLLNTIKNVISIVGDDVSSQ